MEATTANKNINLTVTIANESREIEFLYCNDEKYTSKRIIAARIGNGEKLHRSNLTLWKFDTVAAARAKGYTNDFIFEVDGQVLGLTLKTYIRNRDARVIGWADAYQGTTTATAQKYYGSI